ncbi:MAG: Trk family potassium uptake protein [Clostridia bacterium]|nr:Trk family potassium uptake protein [Clostridia bacterium]
MEETNKIKKRKLSHIQIISIGYLLMIAFGTLLLMLPISTASGEGASFTDALFTTTSASCVTGLILRDTATYWSLFGQIVIILLIQIGGLGFMTISMMFMLFLRKRVGLRRREIMAESIGAFEVRGIMGLSKKIIIGTALFETLGALLLSFRFVPLFGTEKGIYYAVFHSISAFCNAGFDLMGSEYGEFCSLVNFYDDPLVSLTICALIIIGGIGFWVWDDICEKKWRVHRYTLHTKIVLCTTAILLLGGTLIIYFFELYATGKDMGTGERLLTAFFASCTARTAGFNTIDVAAMADGSKLVTILLMFIGGSPGSTAGGIKTTTIVVMILQTLAGVTHRQYVGVFGRRLDNDSLQKATSVLFTNLTLAIGGVIVICITQSSLGLVDVMFEAFSAIGTVGMTTGITRSLGTVSRYVIIFLMYLGRIGSVSFALALMERRTRAAILPPEEKIVIG